MQLFEDLKFLEALRADAQVLFDLTQLVGEGRPALAGFEQGRKAVQDGAAVQFAGGRLGDEAREGGQLFAGEIHLSIRTPPSPPT